MEDWKAWYTLFVLALMTFSLLRERFSPDVIFGSALVLLLVPGILKPQEAVSGFANPQMLTIAALFVVAAAVREAGVLTFLTRRLFGRRYGGRRSLLNLMVPTVALSAFLNNTPLVAMLTPVVCDWAKRHRVSPSKYLIPLSYAAIIGGTCTVIGTSTNLLVSGLLVEYGLEPFAMFRELAPIGCTLAILGVLYLVLFGHRLLPDRRDPYELLEAQSKEYLAELEVQEDSPLAGTTVEDAGLRHLPGLFLIEIVRDGEFLLPVRPTEHLRAGDRLVFTGMAETVVDLQKTPGLVPVTSEAEGDAFDRSVVHLYEAVISRSSPLVGINLRDAQFRRRYDAVVVAVQRSGERIKSKIGDIVLRPGDVLLLQASVGFRRVWRNSSDFYLISSVGENVRGRSKSAFLTVAVAFVMVLAASLRWAPLMVAAFTAVAILVLCRSIRPAAARQAVDLSVLLVIACAIGISKAVENTGLAGAIASGVFSSVESLGVLGVLAAVFVVTNVFTELVTNAAAAATMFPIAMSVAAQTGHDPRAFAVVVAIAASASFSTPIGYQTNLIVYGPGGYRFRDFLIVGLPLNVTAGIVTVLGVWWWWM